MFLYLKLLSKLSKFIYFVKLLTYKYYCEYIELFFAFIRFHVVNYFLNTMCIKIHLKCLIFYYNFIVLCKLKFKLVF